MSKTTITSEEIELDEIEDLIGSILIRSAETIVVRSVEVLWVSSRKVATHGSASCADSL